MSELTKDAVLRTVHTFVLRAGRMTDAQRKAYETLSRPLSPSKRRCSDPRRVYPHPVRIQ